MTRESGCSKTGAALKWFRYSASNGDAKGEYNLASVYEEGLIVGREMDKSLRLLESSATRGYMPAAYRLGLLLSNNQDGTPPDIRAAIYWYTKAAEAGYSAAQYNLGCLHREGIGVRKDIHNATFWIAKAAALGHLRTLLDMADVYLLGLTGEQNFVKAMQSLAAAKVLDESAAEAKTKIASACQSASGERELKFCSQLL